MSIVKLSRICIKIKRKSSGEIALYGNATAKTPFFNTKKQWICPQAATARSAGMAGTECVVPLGPEKKIRPRICSFETCSYVQAKPREDWIVITCIRRDHCPVHTRVLERWTSPSARRASSFLAGTHALDTKTAHRTSYSAWSRRGYDIVPRVHTESAPCSRHHNVTQKSGEHHMHTYIKRCTNEA